MTVDSANPPSVGLLLTEVPRAAREAIGLFNFSWRSQLAKAPKGSLEPVLTIPGFGGGDGSMAALRRYLKQLGYRVYPWSLGRNLPKGRMTDLDQVLAYCELRERQLLERVKHIYKMTGRKVTLIGWSMGGVFANTLAQTHPQWIARVITLGAPLGNPKHTSTWNLLKWMNRSRVPEEMQNVNAWVDRKNRAGTRQVFSTVIYSDRDGAVSEAAAVIENEPLVENIKVQSSHIGYVHNPLVYWVIAERLAQDPEQPKPFDISMQPPKIQQHFVY